MGPGKMGSIADEERTKYRRIWSVPEYANFSPGEAYTERFGEIAKPQPGETVLDIGCGSGRGGQKLTQLYGVSVTYTDHVRLKNGLEPFIEQTLWHPLPARTPKWNYGYCCDVMEHIPTEFVMLTLENIRVACRNAFFSISNIQDGFGHDIGETLHMTVMGFEWWRDHMTEIGEIEDARDLMWESLFYVRCR